jgi:hypothetical protein
MGNAGIVWETNTLKPKMKALPPRIDVAIDAVMEYEANEAQNDMRTYAPWTDRTTNARQGLFAQAGSEDSAGGRDAAGRFTSGGSKKFIVLYHTMPYGIWLELKNNGHYAIILPTVQSAGPQVMASINKVLSALL